MLVAGFHLVLSNSFKSGEELWTPCLIPSWGQDQVEAHKHTLINSLLMMLDNQVFDY